MSSTKMVLIGITFVLTTLTTLDAIPPLDRIGSPSLLTSVVALPAPIPANVDSACHETCKPQCHPECKAKLPRMRTTMVPLKMVVPSVAIVKKQFPVIDLKAKLVDLMKLKEELKIKVASLKPQATHIIPVAIVPLHVKAPVEKCNPCHTPTINHVCCSHVPTYPPCKSCPPSAKSTGLQAEDSAEYMGNQMDGALVPNDDHEQQGLTAYASEVNETVLPIKSKRDVSLKDIDESLSLVKKLELEECLARAICELNCDPEKFGPAGRKANNALIRFDAIAQKRTGTELFREAGLRGITFRSTKHCNKCIEAYSNCGASSTDLISLAGKFIK